MPDTVHTLLVATDGTITDLHLSTNDTAQLTQIHRALGDDAEALHYVHGTDGANTVAFVAEIREGQPPNLYAALALHFLLPQAAITDVRGPVVFAGFTREGRLANLSEDAVRAIRAVEPEIPGTFPAIVRTAH
ncbi:hypothetical protein [Streptomyces alanosinicus]|uniref:DUF3846 domain-containing protein n=1 Tax=Streptomyces alanosinicus TaxID=68171 RepID=A0A918YNE3_9ACTN|nr:hypothetical protein [Streptomyces alanosinicus]GHE09221.1 hypothetical protein GCM10010339_60760 [Streptomyces alanosinicus]